MGSCRQGQHGLEQCHSAATQIRILPTIYPDSNLCERLQMCKNKSREGVALAGIQGQV